MRSFKPQKIGHIDLTESDEYPKDDKTLLPRTLPVLSRIRHTSINRKHLETLARRALRSPGQRARAWQVIPIFTAEARSLYQQRLFEFCEMGRDSCGKILESITVLTGGRVRRPFGFAKG